MELQKKVEESIEKNLRAFKSSEPLLDRAFVVMTNQITDKFYLWQAKDCRKRRKIEVEDLALGNMTTSYELGSAVKVLLY